MKQYVLHGTGKKKITPTHKLYSNSFKKFNQKQKSKKICNLLKKRKLWKSVVVEKPQTIKVFAMALDSLSVQNRA